MIRTGISMLALASLLAAAPLAARDRDGEGLRVRTAVRQNEVLASCFTDNPGVCGIARNIGTNGGPHMLEDAGTAGEMETCQGGVTDDGIPDCSAMTGKKVDNAWRKPGFAKQLIADPC